MASRVAELHFTDFLNALVYCATFKRLPTDEQIFEFGFVNAAEFMIEMPKVEPAAWLTFLNGGLRDWAHDPLPQPIHRLVDHIASYVLAASRASRKRKDPKAKKK
jgi:hypothetical protein